MNKIEKESTNQYIIVWLVDYARREKKINYKKSYNINIFNRRS